MAGKAKKLLKLAIVVFIVLLLGGIIFLFAGLGAAVKKGVETSAPKFLLAPVTIEKVSLSPLSGNGKIRGLVVGNPEGFKTDSAFTLGLIEMDLDLGSLKSDTIVINRIVIQQPQITYERGLKTSNIQQLLDNVQASTAGEDDEAEDPEKSPEDGEKSGKKVLIKALDINDGSARVTVKALMGKTLTLPVPDIHMENIGKADDENDGGTSKAEAITAVLTRVLGEVVKVMGNVDELKGIAGDTLEKGEATLKEGEEALKKGGEALKKGGEALGEAADGVTKGLKGLLKKDKD